MAGGVFRSGNGTGHDPRNSTPLQSQSRYVRLPTRLPASPGPRLVPPCPAPTTLPHRAAAPACPGAARLLTPPRPPNPGLLCPCTVASDGRPTTLPGTCSAPHSHQPSRGGGHLAPSRLHVCKGHRPPAPDLAPRLNLGARNVGDSRGLASFHHRSRPAIRPAHHPATPGSPAEVRRCAASTPTAVTMKHTCSPSLPTSPSSFRPAIQSPQVQTNRGLSSSAEGQRSSAVSARMFTPLLR